MVIFSVIWCIVGAIWLYQNNSGNYQTFSEDGDRFLWNIILATVIYDGFVAANDILHTYLAKKEAKEDEKERQEAQNDAKDAKETEPLEVA